MADFLRNDNGEIRYVVVFEGIQVVGVTCTIQGLLRGLSKAEAYWMSIDKGLYDEIRQARNLPYYVLRVADGVYQISREPMLC